MELQIQIMQVNLNRKWFRNYAISAEATKSGATWNFGLYAKAENATYNYAAYFPKGDVRIYDKLELGVSSNYGEFMYVDGTQGSGKVLTSDANGNASWNDIIYPWTVNPSGHAYRNSNIGTISSTNERSKCSTPINWYSWDINSQVVMGLLVRIGGHFGLQYSWKYI